MTTIAIRLPEHLGLSGRGEVRVGAHADLAVFDPLAFREEGTTFDPSRLAVGMDTVIVNGTVTREHNKDALDREGPLPGILLREFAPNPSQARPRPIPQWIRDEVDDEWDARVARVMEITGGNPPADPAQPGRFLV